MTLRQKVVAGGVHLVARQLVVLVVGMIGALALTRLLGPRDYGRYAGSLTIVLFITALSRSGVDQFLIRRPEPPTRETYDNAFTLQFGTGLLFGFGGALLAPLVIGRVSDDDFTAPTQLLLLALPLTLAAYPWLASLERELDYRRVAFVEVSGHLVFNVSAVALAVADLGVWAPVIAYWLWQLTLVAGVLVAARVVPRVRFSRSFSREALRYGLPYTGSDLAWRARDLANPLVVGRYLGPRGVAYVALTMTIVNALSFAKGAVGRIFFATVSRLREDTARLRVAAEEAILVQMLVVGGVLVAFALVAKPLVPVLLGDEWRPLLTIYPWFALSALINTIFNVHSLVLYSYARILPVALFHATSTAIVFVLAVALVRSDGLVGFGIAELASAVSYLILHVALARVLDIGYGRPALWLAGFAPLLFVTDVHGLWQLLLPLPMAVVLLLPDTHATVRRYLHDLRRMASPTTPAGQ